MNNFRPTEGTQVDDNKTMEEDGPPHWYRDCLVCGKDFILPVCPHKDATCPEGHAVVTDTNDCDCFDNRELLEYPCNCEYCMKAAGYKRPILDKLKQKLSYLRYCFQLSTIKRNLYWNYRYAKGWALREPPCGDCECRGCRGECCGAVGW